MANRKKKKYSEYELHLAEAERCLSEISETLVEEIMGCADVQALVRKHFLAEPKKFLAGVSLLFEVMDVARSPNEELLSTSLGSLFEYLAESSKILGLTHVAALVKSDFPAAVIEFEKVTESLDPSQLIKNARALDLLMI
jgi:hypothetical protein